MSKTWSWKPSLGKGRGVFAMKALEAGTLIMRDVEEMRTSHNAQSPDPIQDSFDCLSPADRAEFMRLHEGDQPLPTKVQRIFKANAFGSQDGNFSFMYLHICKANHSCIPNAEVIPHEDDSPAKPRLVAIKPIDKDEEIFITYNTVLHMKQRSERQEYLRQHFDFQCSCTICTADSHAVAISDARRLLLSIVYPVIQNAGAGSIPQLEAMQKQAFSRSSLDVSSKWQSLLITSPATIRCTFNLLIARLLEAEGIPCYQAGSAYLDAATMLLSQMQDRHDGIILLSAAVNVKEWVEAGKRIVTTLYGATSLTGEWATEYARSIEDKEFELFVAKSFHDGQHETEAVARRCKDVKLLKRLREAYALHFIFQHDGIATYEMISERDCKQIVRQYRIDPLARLEAARAMDVFMEDCYETAEMNEH